METDRKGKDVVALPLTVEAVKVTNVIDPYLMRVCLMKEYDKKIDAICKKLMNSYNRGLFQRSKISEEPKYGDYVAIYVKWNLNLDLPAWWCRGVVCCEKSDNSKYTILLIDYGTCIELWREGFVVIPKSLVPEPGISSTVSVCNLLPTLDRRENSRGKEESIQLLCDEWSPQSVQLTKDLIVGAREIFFDRFYTNENNVQFGELYLDLEGEIIRLSDALVACLHAVRLDRNFVRCARNRESLEKRSFEDKTLCCFTSGSKSVSEISRTRIASDSRHRQIIHGIERDRLRVLVFSKTECGFLTSVSDAKFPTEIHMAWNDLTRSSRPRKIQAYVWPAIKKGLDVLAIGTKSCGKTLGVVTAVCGHVASLKNIPRGKEPLALILCASSSHVLKFSGFCHELLRDYNKIKTVSAINGKTDRSLVAEMFNGCQVLISTPNFLARFLSRNKKMFTFEKLRFLVLDDADVILDKYSDAIKRLLVAHEVVRNRDNEIGDAVLQTIMTGRQWTPNLKKFSYALLKCPYICIASFLEAAVFKCVRPKLYVMNSRYKLKNLPDLLADDYKKMRTVIVCANMSEAEELDARLSGERQTLLVHEETKANKIAGIKSSWQAAVTGSYPILITTDEALSDLDVTNAEWLIHYSIALSHKTRFNFRYSTLYDNLSKEKCKSQVSILADENNDFQFQSIVGMMQRMKVALSPEMQKNIKRMAIALEQKKKNRSVCDKTKSLGFCPEQSSCPFRHCILQKVDDPLTNIRINDRVKFMVICLHDASHMSARIISYIDSDTQEEIQFPSADYVALYAKMRQFYSAVENRRCYKEINVGDVCSIEESLDDFKRVQIIHVEEQEGADRPSFVNVRCIDNGIVTERVKPYKLLHLPEDLRSLPCQAVDVFLSNIAPQDDEYSWDSTAVKLVRNWFKDNVDERSYVIGTVKLHLGNTIWVDTLEVGTKLVGYQDLLGSSLKQELLKHELAVVNEQHINDLYKLCMSVDYRSINGVDISTSTESSG